MADQLLEVLRKEQKYPMSHMEAEYMYYKLANVMQQDAHNGENGYLVRSLYFDTFNDTDYNDKDGGYEMRRKIRLRIYNPNDKVAKLELKEKQGDFQRKRSLLLTREDAIELCSCNYDVIRKYDTEFAREIYGRMQEKFYRPKVIVEYDRRGFVVKENDIRITLDSNIRANENNLNLFDSELNCYPVGKLTQVTMEVKFNHFILSYVKDLVSLSNRSQISLSKYCAARMASLGGMA